MARPEKKKVTVVEEELEEEVNTDETDELHLFIRRTQLQNRVLKKMTEKLSGQPNDLDTIEGSTKS